MRALRHPSAPLNLAGRPPILHKAAATEHRTPILSLLLSFKADVELADGAGTRALHVAARSDTAGAIELLLGAGAHVDAQRTSGASAIYLAAQSNACRSLSTLLGAGAKVDLPKEGGFTPLMVAAMRNHAGAVAMLLHGGAQPDRAYDVADRWTALMLAAYFGHLEVLKELCEGGASLRLTDPAGRTALDIARAAGNDAAAALLAEREEEEAHASEAAARESLLQELQWLAPEQGSLEMDPSSLDRLRALIDGAAKPPDLGGGVHAAVSRLHAHCTIIASTLLPASTMASEVSKYDADTARLEEQVSEARASYDTAVQAVREASADSIADAAAARERARHAYVRALGTLHARYDERQMRGDKLVALRSRLQTEVEDLGAGSGDSTGAKSPVSMQEALGSAVPVLRCALDRIGSAHAETVAAMAALERALQQEHEAVEALERPLAEAVEACAAASQESMHELLAGDPKAEMKHLSVLTASVVSQARASRIAASVPGCGEMAGHMSRRLLGQSCQIRVFGQRRHRRGFSPDAHLIRLAAQIIN